MKRIPRLLLVALALSLLLHLVVALLLHPPSFSAESQAEVVSIERRPTTIAAARVPPPPPPATPKPSIPRPRGRALPLGKAPGPGGGSGTPLPAPAVAAATPTASASPSSGCSKPNAAAAVIATPQPPDIAPAARASGTSGTTLVSVQLDAAGQVDGTDVTQSSGNSSLDIVALAMARDARYAPAVRDCKPVAGAYAFSVKFVAW